MLVVFLSVKRGRTIRGQGSKLADTVYIIYSGIGSDKGRMLRKNKIDPGLEGGYGQLYRAWEELEVLDLHECGRWMWVKMREEE